MNEKEKAHEKISNLFREMEDLTESQPEEFMQKLRMALVLIKIEYNKLKLI